MLNQLTINFWKIFKAWLNVKNTKDNNCLVCLLLVQSLLRDVCRVFETTKYFQGLI
jgi:hypothetical protein